MGKKHVEKCHKWQEKHRETVGQYWGDWGRYDPQLNWIIGIMGPFDVKPLR